MNVLSRVTWKAMWQNRSRTMVTIVGIILSAAMFTAVATLGISLVSYMIDSELQTSGDYYIQYDYATDENRNKLMQEDSVSNVGDLEVLGFFSMNTQPQEEAGTDTFILAAGDPSFYNMVAVHPVEGRLPKTSSEVAIPQSVYSILQTVGLPCQIGDSITLEVFPELKNSEISLPHMDGSGFTKTYKIVGILDSNVHFSDFSLALNHLLTCSDEQFPAQWHRLFVKTEHADQAYTLSETPYGQVINLNYNLLRLKGASGYLNINTLIYRLCGVLMAIIMIGSGSLIYNAFSISVSERTKQFGLLSSIGATRKQLRHSVYFEACSLCLIGIPLGILFGYFGIAATLYFIRDAIGMFLGSPGSASVVLTAVPSGSAFAAAALVALLTVLISCTIPARRANRIAPIMAIRQSQEYQVPKKAVRIGKLSGKVFGLPGLLAKKYYFVSKKKYRTTIFSIVISLILFISAFSFTSQLQVIFEQNSNTNNFDFDVSFDSEQQLNQIRSHPAVAASAIRKNNVYGSIIADSSFSDRYRTAWQAANGPDYQDLDIGEKYIHIYYLEDEVLLHYLQQHHIDSQPYFDAEFPTALVCNANLIAYSFDDNGSSRTVYREQILRSEVDSLPLYSYELPDEVKQYLSRICSSHYSVSLKRIGNVPTYAIRFDADTDSGQTKQNPYMTEFGMLYIAMLERVENGTLTRTYHLLNPKNKKMDETALATVSMPEHQGQIHLGAAVDTVPFGIPSDFTTDRITLVLPLSAAPSTDVMEEVTIKASDYHSFVQFLDENKFFYYDCLAEEMTWRSYIMVINIFCYGFIVLISLICVCNVFNTICTNIALRRRDFGMLRSVGIKNRELYQMVSFECLQYGIKALLIGLPLAIAASLGIYQLIGGLSGTKYHLPMAAIIIAVIAVFVLVFITMFYAVSKVKKATPIEAIRTENL